jgi:glycosyltransferase involved in cell wall biosynthesis
LYVRGVPGPELTVVVLVGALRSRVEGVLEALARQSSRDAIEVVIADAAPDSVPLAVPAGLDVRTVVAPTGATLGAIRALGIEAARAPVVAFLEDHSYPEPGWAAALIEASAGPWAAIGYAFRVADPQTWGGRAAAVSEYGQWLDPVRSGPRTMLAGNNVAYRRAALERFGDRLPGLLDVDFNLQRELLAAGERLFVAGDAIVRHEHFVRLRDTMRAGGLYCDLLAQRRSHSWSLPRRLLYALLIPVVAPMRRLQALLGALPHRPGLLRQLAFTAPAVAILFVNAALGESLGYLRLRRHTPERFTRIELEMSRTGGARP